MTADDSKASGFFAIDSRIWGKVAEYGLGEAVAYLVLACGTGHSNKLTTWSTQSVMKYAGMGWNRAQPSIERLIQGGFIRRAENHATAKPKYELATFPELLKFKTPKQPDYVEQELLAQLRAGKQPSRTKAALSCAERLVQLGLVQKDATGRYAMLESTSEAPTESLIWLPNEIVKGTSKGEDSPVRRLRSTGCPWTLRLFIELYAEQNLRDDGGISPRLIRKEFERRKIGEQGAYIIWGFKEKGSTHWWSGPFEPHKKRNKLKPDDTPTWDSIRLLQNMGLLSYVPHIFENDTDSAEPVHAYGDGGAAEVPIELEIGQAADGAGQAMSLPSALEEAIDEGFDLFCPVLKTLPAAQMIGVARLRYRPHTRRSATWFSELQQSGPIWIQVYKELRAKGKLAGQRREARYA